MSKILLVDDDALLVRMYQKKLENDGFTVATASDGVEALDKLGEFKPDLMLLDIMMPKMNGLQVLEKMKNDGISKNTPVIVLTNVGANDEDVERGLELGAVSYLVKAGNRPKAVVSKIKEVLGGYTREIPKVQE
jgi:CheY-like chemotaxis protein